ALAYVRARHSGRGDLDRVQRQQEFLGSLIKKSTSPATALNPFRSGPLLLRPSTTPHTSRTRSASPSPCAPSATAAASPPPSRSPAPRPSAAPAPSSAGTADAPWRCYGRS